MQCEIVAVGTELLLGQIVDTNSAFLGDILAANGIDSFYQTKVGDNLDRIVEVLRLGLSRSDAVIVCGGLGPTADDITREAIAKVMGVNLVRDDIVLARIEELFRVRNRDMANTNKKQADVPVGALVIAQTMGTAPGLICPVDDKVIYAMPGVPYEMRDMAERAVLPDLLKRSGELGVIASRTLRTWGESESQLDQMLQPRMAQLDESASRGDQNVPTIAFLASGMEGMKVRATVKANDLETANILLDREEETIRSIIGDIVFGVDDESMETVVGSLLSARNLTLGLAESLTGGLVASRLTDIAGASQWFKGSIVSYANQVKFDVLGVQEGPVVSEHAARDMAEGALRVLDVDVALSLTGVAGPDMQEDKRVGTLFVGVARAGKATEVKQFLLFGDRLRIRQYATISALDLLRRSLLAS